MFTQSEENYLKAIFKLQQEAENGVSTSSLSEILETKAASVTEMVKKLAEKKLVSYKKYYGAALTDAGRKQALAVVRKHRLWETFLVERLGFNWDEVHEVAEQLEHIKSEKLIDAIDKLLDFPKADPHGDLIPDKDGKVVKKNKTLLCDCRAGASGDIVGVKDSSQGFLQYLDKNNISLGQELKIKRKEDFDHSVLIDIGGKEISISEKIACNLYLRLN